LIFSFIFLLYICTVEISWCDRLRRKTIYDKKWSFYSCIALIIVYLSSGFKPFEQQNHSWFLVNSKDKLTYSFPSREPMDYANLKIPFTGKYFIGFKEAIAFKESQGKYKRINSLGCLGKYQFASETLKTIGINDSLSF